MVDYNNETTVGMPPADLIKIQILERRAYLFDMLEEFNKKRCKGITINSAYVRSRLYSLFLELQGMLKRRMKEEDYKQLLEWILSDKWEHTEKAILYINEYLDRLGLTKIDTKQNIDLTIIEDENKSKNL